MFSSGLDDRQNTRELVKKVRYIFDQFILDTERFEISENGVAIHAEPQVIELIIFLIQNRSRLVSRDELIATVWKGRLVSDSAISGRIKAARKLLGDDGRQQKYIQTVYKKGFSFTTPGLEEEISCVQTRGFKKSSYQIEFDTTVRHGHDSRPSIGILKFVNFSHSQQQNYFADGITEDLITTLSKISKLIVVAHPGAREGNNNSVNAIQAAIDLGVHYVLYGSVRIDGERLRISVHLINAQTGQYQWAQRYDCPNREFFEVQDQLTKEIVSALQVELTEGDQALLLSRGTDNLEAWQLTFQGQNAVLEHHQNSVRLGLLHLQKAVQLDENYALAWSALAVAHWKESLNEGWSDSRKNSLRQAQQASDRALKYEPENASILAMRSLILISLEDFDEALKLARQALHLADSEGTTIAIAAITLRYCCQPEQSIAYTRKAMELCPVYPAWYPYGIAICHWMTGQYELATKFIEEAIAIDSGLSLNYLVLIMIYSETGQGEKSGDAVQSIIRIDPKFSSRAFTQGMPFSDPVIQQRRDMAFKKAGVPE